MIVDLEQLKKAKLSVAVMWTTMNSDSALAPDILYVSDLLRGIIDDVELYHVAAIVEPGTSVVRLVIEKEGGNDGTDKRTETGSDTAGSS